MSETAEDDNKPLRLLTLCVAGACAVISIWSLVLGGQLRTMRGEVATKQTAIARGQTIAKANQQVIELLAKASAQTGNQEISALLERNGITFKVNAPANPQTQPPTPQATP